MKIELFPHEKARPGAQEVERRIVDAALALGIPAKRVSMINYGPQTLLIQYGTGAPDRTARMHRQIKEGGHCLCIDQGYFGGPGNYRLAIDELHLKPQYLEKTSSSEARFRVYKIPLREDYDENGKVIVVGLGPKSRIGLQIIGWERRALEDAAKRFPRRQIVYRPKFSKQTIAMRFNRRDGVEWKNRDGLTPIAALLKGSSRVICRHSNVAIDATIAGIPVECEDGIARWLYQNGAWQSPERRAELLARAAWWNWNYTEMEAALKHTLPFVS